MRLRSHRRQRRLWWHKEESQGTRASRPLWFCPVNPVKNKTSSKNGPPMPNLPDRIPRDCSSRRTPLGMGSGCGGSKPTSELALLPAKRHVSPLATSISGHLGPPPATPPAHFALDQRRVQWTTRCILDTGVLDRNRHEGSGSC
jgi:hypothetical protein